MLIGSQELWFPIVIAGTNQSNSVNHVWVVALLGYLYMWPVFHSCLHSVGGTKALCSSLAQPTTQLTQWG